MIYSAATAKNIEPFIADAETDLEKLDRLKRSLDHYERQGGRHAGVQAARLRRMVINLSNRIAEVA